MQMAARICLVLSTLFFLFGWGVLCYCPGEFLIAAALCVLPICFGRQSIRAIAILLFAASLISASHMYLKDQQLKAKVQRIRLMQQKNPPSKPLARWRAERIVQAA